MFTIPLMSPGYNLDQTLGLKMAIALKDISSFETRM